jgi:ATP-binding cassette, subfamily B, bacterial
MHSQPVSHELRTAHLRFVYAPGSHAAQLAETLAASAERAFQRAWDWLGQHNQPAPSVQVHLVDPPGSDVPQGLGLLSIGSAWLAPDRDVVWQPAAPESPIVGLEGVIVCVQARACLGGTWAEHVPLLRALGELLSAGALASDTLASPRTDLFVTSGDAHADASFLGYLLRTYGEPAFARFVQAALRSDATHAAATAYGHTFDALQREWLARLNAPRPGERGSRDVLRQSARLLRPYTRAEVELLLLMTFDACLGLAIPLSTKYLFDQVITPNDLSRLGPWLIVICVVFGAGLLATYRRMLLSGRIGESVLRDLRRSAFSHLQRLSQRFYLRSSTGDLLSRLTNDMYAVEQALAHVLPSLAFQILSLALGCAALLLLNFLMGMLVLCVGVPLFAVMYTRASRHVRQASRALQEQYSVELAFLNEQLTSQSVVKPFGLEERAVLSFENILGELFERSLRLVRLGAGLSLGSQMVVLAIQLTVFGLGAVLIANGRLTIGGLVAFSGLIGPVLSPIAGIAEQYRVLQGSVGALDRIEELLSEVPEVVEDPLAIDVPRFSREVRFEGVTFGYTRDEPVLHSIALTIPAGARVAFVGASGSGKSTLAGLLVRQFDPDVGRVLFDGRDIREGTLASIRGQQAIVPQDTLLFNVSIAENIRLGRPNATDAEVEAAARAAALHEFVSQLPHGYASQVGERGQWLSGGQRQRLAIARALIRDPQLLLLDEATSALDATTESAILATLDRAAQHRTLVMITHRLAAAMRCDQIFVLAEGRVREHGTHADLMRQRGIYWKLFNEQLMRGTERPAVLDPALLVRIPLFARLGANDLTALATRLSTEEYAPGAEIVRQGEHADRLYLIGRGRVEVVHEGTPPLVVKVLGEGTFFGEIALLGVEDGVRTATVRALDQTQVFALHRQDFLSLLEAQPRLAEAITRLATRRHAQLEELVRNSAGIV